MHEMHRFMHSMKNAIRGLRVVTEEQNSIIQLVSAVIAIGTGVLFNISATEWMLLIFAIGIVISAETFNSAIERLTDEHSPAHNPHAQYIKDVSAGAVLIAAITAAIIGIMLFFPYITSLL